MQYSNFPDFYHYKKINKNNWGGSVHVCIDSSQKKMIRVEIVHSSGIISYYFEIRNNNFDLAAIN